MEEVRQLVQEEGREARNLIAFHVAVDNPAGRVPRKPPRAGVPPPRRPAPRTPARLRSASAGRDKRSEYRARYWALLFGDLQRAVGEIYNTVEVHENPNECQEVILVLENYTRDFKALCEWFRLKWEYESTPPPQRPQSLAWEIRKTDFVRPESRRTHSVKSSPSVSGKNSPSLSGHNTPSGKNSPNLTGKASPGSGKISPRMSGHVTSPKGNVEFFSSKVTSKTASKPEPKLSKESRLSDIKEKDVHNVIDEANNEKQKEAKGIKIDDIATVKDEKDLCEPMVELGKAKEIPNVAPKHVIVKSPKQSQGKGPVDKKVMTNGELSTQATATIDKLNAMESEFLVKNLTQNAANNENLLNRDQEIAKNSKTTEVSNEISIVIESIDQESVSTESPSKSDDNFADISNESSKCDDKVPEINSDWTKPKHLAKVENNKLKQENTNASGIKVNESLKYNDSMVKITNDCAAKEVDLEEIINHNVLKDIKPKDIPKSNVKVKGKAKIEAQTNEKELSKIQLTKKEPKNTKKPEENKDTKKEDNKIAENKFQIEHYPKKDEPKKLETRPIFQLKSAAKPEYSQTVEDIYNKKEEIKKLETRPIFENKPVSRPAYNQAMVDFNKKEDIIIKKVEPKLLLELKPAARPAYSQAAAKPKLITAKTEVKTPTKTLARSKTVVEIRPYPATTTRTFVNRNQKNKCSYPFNLTTGRSSLFDGGTNKIANTKKPPMSKPLLAAGDNRNQTKADPKRPPRPMSLKINEKGDEQEKLNSAFEKNKDFDYSSTETVVTQIDMSRIESSESLKTIVPENEHDITNSIEVLNIDGNKNDNEGWLTVKSRRLSRESKKSKSHWANRFNQPSATTSLPTLNMIESPKSETNPITASQLDRAKSEQPQNKPEPKVEIVVNVAVEPKHEKAKDMSMIRQKSDVTGLKTKSSRTKALKKDKKIKDSEEKLTKNRLHSSLESLTMGLARSQESTDDAFDFDKWRAEFKSTFKYLEDYDQIEDDTEILKTADPSEMSEIAEMTSQIEENERKISLALDFQTEVDQRKLCAEEDLLNRQIMELQQVSDIDMDTETDDTETDAEILCEDSALESACQSTDTLSSLSARLEDQYETALAGMSWAERVDTLGALEALVARDPGRAQQLHAKLSQGMKRRGSLQDALRRLQAKQARAEKQRRHFHTERAKKIHQLLARVEEVKVAKNQLIDEKRIRMERRLQKAAENRDQHLKDIVRKAHDEEEKLREIAFIKQLEAENRRHEFLEQCRSHTTRLREMRRERLDKLEQKSAREAAVGARKKALEAARKQHVENLVEKRKERDARVEELKEQKRQERDDAARERAQGVRSRLSALAAAAELEAHALRSRIQDKQDASQLRLESHLQAIRVKATGPRQATTSESQEPDKSEDEVKAALEREKKERERQKNTRKKARKLRQKLLTIDAETQALSDALPRQPPSPASPCAKLHRLITQIDNLLRTFLPDEIEFHQHINVIEDVKEKFATNNNLDEEKPSKKKKKKKDRQLSASESVSSSVSDMRTGTKPVAPSATDLVALEKLLNELHRMVTASENINSILKTDATIFTQIHMIKTLDKMLCFAIEAEDLAPQLNIRSLNTCVTILYKMAEACSLFASLWLAHPGIVYSVVLLQQQMEKNMMSDPKEDELTKTLAGALAVALNNILLDTHPMISLRAKRCRGHNIISFICLSGVVSYPDRCNESRRSIQTLLNVCGDVLLPLPTDGSERAVAQQNLRSVLNPHIFNMRNDFCMLFAEGAEITHNDVFVNAARIAHVLRALAEIDYRIVQDGFGEGGWPLEFRAAVARLMTQHAPSDKEAPRKQALRPGVIRLDAKVSLTFVLDLIELIGYVTVNNPSLRDTICDNWSVVKMLCNLPANWIVSRPQMHKLLPTLLVLAERPATAEVIASEISLEMLQQYMRSETAQKVKLIQLLKLEQNGILKNKKTKKSTSCDL